MHEWHPHYKYWVAEKSSGPGWTCVYKTNYLFLAKRKARKKSKKGYRMKVEFRGASDA